MEDVDAVRNATETPAPSSNAAWVCDVPEVWLSAVVSSVLTSASELGVSGINMEGIPGGETASPGPEPVSEPEPEPVPPPEPGQGARKLPCCRG